MNFLIILVAVWLVHQGEWLPAFQRDEWFSSWMERLREVATGQDWTPFLLLVLVPVLLVALLLLLTSDVWWLAVIINTAVLFYAIGRGSWRDECHSWVRFFAERDPVLLRQKLGATELADMSDADVESIWLKAREAVLYQQLEGFYTTVFWFFFAGAPAALFYRLIQLYRQEMQTRQGDLSTVDFILLMMEWLPVRLMAMLFCLVGNFSTGFWVLRQVFADASLPSTVALARCADAALFLDGSVDDDIDEDDEDLPRSRAAKMIERMESQSLEQRTLAVMRRYSVELEALLKRSEWAFLALIAIIALL